MSKILDRRLIPAGTYIFHEGDEARTAYLIASGKVSIERQVNGETVHLVTLTKGGFFGEMALIDGKPRSADAKVIENAEIVAIDESTFEKNLDQLNDFMRAWVNMLMTTIRRLTNRVDS
ncbi:MAG: cyclic nucleotide-binding domain-containing protein [Alphaproteobacteria bacterium]|nr:cyclic nucleotide-binding domain-containing protein [Alphaproteobacteria bacterium SS10]